MPNGNPKNSQIRSSNYATRTNQLSTGLTMTLDAVEQNVVNIVLKCRVLEANFLNFITKPLRNSRLSFRTSNCVALSGIETQICDESANFFCLDSFRDKTDI